MFIGRKLNLENKTNNKVKHALNMLHNNYWSVVIECGCVYVSVGGV